jgi:metal-dependent amidase/aminoacylase/carboxypeptidase family protein
LDYIWGYPPVVNHEQEARRFFKVAEELFGAGNALESPLIMAGEDFSYYLQHVPGCFMFVGAGNPEASITAPHHHPRFDIDERAILYSAKLLSRLALDKLAAIN